MEEKTLRCPRPRSGRKKLKLLTLAGVNYLATTRPRSGREKKSGRLYLRVGNIKPAALRDAVTRNINIRGREILSWRAAAQRPLKKIGFFNICEREILSRCAATQRLLKKIYASNIR